MLYVTSDAVHNTLTGARYLHSGMQQQSHSFLSFFEPSLPEKAVFGIILETGYKQAAS